MRLLELEMKRKQFEFQHQLDFVFLFLLFFCLNIISYNVRSKSKKSSYRELMQFTMPNRQRGNRTKKKHTHTRKKLIETVGQGYK